MASLILSRQRRQAQYFTESLGPHLGLDMVLIPGGSYAMGAAATEPGSAESERPQHRVNVPTFFLGRYPVTQAQWLAVASWPAIHQPLEPEPAAYRAESGPVEQISWAAAVEFCDRLSAYTGRPYRLPSEAEWEYACRAHTTTPFCFGPQLLPELANYNSVYSYGGSPTATPRAAPTPVDRFELANGFGLWDMHGNVYEWCQDHWHPTYAGAPADGQPWIDPPATATAARVIRGGCWDSPPADCRCAHRSQLAASPQTRDSRIGLRVACGPEPG